MDNREFLNKIRKLQESGKKIGVTDFPVNNKENVALLMESEASKLLNEEEIQTIEPDEQKDEENRKLADRSKYKKQKNRSYLYIIIITTNIYNILRTQH